MNLDLMLLIDKQVLETPFYGQPPAVGHFKHTQTDQQVQAVD